MAQGVFEGCADGHLIIDDEDTSSIDGVWLLELMLDRCIHEDTRCGQRSHVTGVIGTQKAGLEWGSFRYREGDGEGCPLAYSGLHFDLTGILIHNLT